MTLTKRIFLFLSLILSFEGFGQHAYFSTAIREEVKTLFDKKVKNVWVVLSSGKLDNMHVVDMAFGTDGSSIKGFYYIRSSGERFELDGSEINGVFKLVESNKRGKTTGFVLGKFDGHNFSGKWFNADRQSQLTFETTMVESFDQYHPVLCDHRTWHAYYQGKIENNTYQVFIHKDDNQYQVYTKNAEFTLLDTTITPEQNQILTFPLTNTHKAIFDTESPDYIVAENEINFQNYLLKREGHALFECFEFANFTTRIETMRPVISNKKFNHWLDHEFKNWYEQGHIKINLPPDESLPNQYRYKDVGYGWVELTFLNDQYISGHVFTQASWKKGTEKKSFIFDLKSSKMVKAQEFLYETTEQSHVVDSILSERKKSMPLKDKKVKEWVFAQKFDHITLEKSGVCFETGFSNIYGEYEIIIPYAELKPYYKSKSILKNF